MTLPAREIHKLPFVKMGKGPRRGMNAYHLRSSASVSGDIAVDNLILWLDAADLDATLDDSDPVASWVDKTAFNNDVAQATEADKPTFRTNAKNGLPVVDFNDTSDALINAAPDTGISGTGLDVTIALVINAAIFTLYYIMSLDNAGNDHAVQFNNTFGIVVPPVAAAGYTADYAIVLYDYRASDGRCRFYRNASKEDEEINAGTPVFDKIHIGGYGGGSANFSIGEIRVWDRILTDGEISNLFAALNTKWNVY